MADEVIRIRPLALGEHENYVMFDVESLPPHLDEIDKVYLWGLKIYGKRPRQHMACEAGFGQAGDREGWEQFLQQCQNIFDGYGDVPFVHWSHYEATKVRSYIKRYDDRDGIAERLLGNLVDLLPKTREALVVPEPSYSLKVIEKRAEYKRAYKEYDADWAMAQYIEATETEDPELRDQMIAEIKKYNEEDLDATWAVLQWIRSCFE